jgi:hypothetical protein
MPPFPDDGGLRTQFSNARFPRLPDSTGTRLVFFHDGGGWRFFAGSPRHSPAKQCGYLRNWIAFDQRFALFGLAPPPLLFARPPAPRWGMLFAHLHRDRLQ